MRFESVDIKGKRFGSFVALELHHKKQIYRNGAKWGNVEYWLCKCDCGNTKIINKSHLTRGNTTSCGCKTLYRNKHGMRNTRIYKIWSDMRNRCSNKNNKAYKYYGERGIKVDSIWDKEFQPFYDWAMANGYKENLTIDRIDVNGNYEPSNCRWISQQKQMRNHRKNHLITYKDETHCIADWAEKFNIPYSTFRKRIADGMSIEEASNPHINSPHEKRTNRKVYCQEINIIFNTVVEAKKYCLENFNSKGDIYRSCKSDHLKACGFKWFFYQEENKV